MAKRGYELPRITEPDENTVHYVGYPMQDAMTLCNLTDFIGATYGEKTAQPADCNMCLAMVDYAKGRLKHRSRAGEG